VSTVLTTKRTCFLLFLVKALKIGFISFDLSSLEKAPFIPFYSSDCFCKVLDENVRIFNSLFMATQIKRDESDFQNCTVPY